MRSFTVLGAFLLCCAACGDTFRNGKTGETVEGQLLGRVTVEGREAWLVKTAKGTKRLPTADWDHAHADGPKPATAKPPEPAFEWPEIEYAGRKRDARWLERAYTATADQVVLCGEVALNRHDIIPKPVMISTQYPGGRTTGGGLSDGRARAVGQAFGAHVVIERLLDGERAVDRLQNEQAVVLDGFTTTGWVDGTHLNAVLVGVGTWRDETGSTILRCRELPKGNLKVSRDEFLNALRLGVTIYRERRCPICGGSGLLDRRVEKGPRLSHRSPLDPIARGLCPHCKGEGVERQAVRD